MRRWSFLGIAAALLLVAVPAHAQSVPLAIGVVEVDAQPSGACNPGGVNPPAQWVRGSSIFCYCPAAAGSTWTCQTVGGGTGSSNWADLQGGTVSNQGMVVGPGASITTTGGGTIAATTATTADSATTAGSLSGTLTQCAAGQAPRGITNAGSAQNCTAYQGANGNLTTWGGIAPSANVQSLVAAANYAAMRGLLDLEAGTDFLAFPAGTPTGSKFLRDDNSWQSIPGGGDALTASPLSQFASTTSSQLATVLSNETGTGLVVFSTNPVLTTPNLGTPSSVNLANATNLQLSTGVSGKLPFANLADGSANSVLGVAGNAAGAQASIQASTDFTVMRRSGASVGFGAVPLDQPAAVSGRLPEGNVDTAIARASQVPSLETDPGVPLLNVADLGDFCAGLEGVRRNSGDTSNQCFTPLSTNTGAQAASDVRDLVSALSYGAMRGLLDLEAGTDFLAFPTGTPTGSKFLRDDNSWQSIPGGGDALTTSPLSQFASTSSTQLAGVLNDETGTGGGFVRATSPVLVTPNLGTPSAVTLTNGTGLPIAGISGLGTGVGTLLATPSSSNVAAAVTDETGTGLVVFNTSPALVTPNLGTPSAVNLANATNMPVGQVSGMGTGVGTFLATPSSANFAAAVTGETGTGGVVLSNSPTLVSPALGTPSAVDLTNATSIPMGQATGTLLGARMEAASASNAGAMSTGTQTLAGFKTFQNGASLNGGLLTTVSVNGITSWLGTNYPPAPFASNGVNADGDQTKEVDCSSGFCVVDSNDDGVPDFTLNVTFQMKGNRIGTTGSVFYVEAVGSVCFDVDTEAGPLAPFCIDASGITANQLAANPSNCSAGNVPLGISATGVAEGCLDITTQSEHDAHAASGTAHGSTAAATDSAIAQRDANGDIAFGTVKPSADNTDDLGSSSSLYWRKLFLKTSINFGGAGIIETNVANTAANVGLTVYNSTALTTAGTFLFAVDKDNAGTHVFTVGRSGAGTTQAMQMGPDGSTGFKMVCNASGVCTGTAIGSAPTLTFGTASQAHSLVGDVSVPTASTWSVSGANSSKPFRHASDCSGDTTLGFACLDTDDGKVYVGNGSSAVQLGGSGGGNVSSFPHAVWVSGRYYGPETAGVIAPNITTNTGQASGDLVLEPICTGATSVVINQIAVRVNSGPVGASGDKIRLGLYANNASTFQPTGAPLEDSGDITNETANTNVVYNLGSNRTLSANTCYWIAIIDNDSDNSVQYTGIDTNEGEDTVNSPMGTSGPDNPTLIAIGYQMSGAGFGALPTISGPSLVTSDRPRLWVRVN